jgi:hypothetical protein
MGLHGLFQRYPYPTLPKHLASIFPSELRSFKCYPPYGFPKCWKRRFGRPWMAQRLCASNPNSLPATSLSRFNYCLSCLLFTCKHSFSVNTLLPVAPERRQLLQLGQVLALTRLADLSSFVGLFRLHIRRVTVNQQNTQWRAADFTYWPLTWPPSAGVVIVICRKKRRVPANCDRSSCLGTK